MLDNQSSMLILDFQNKHGAAVSKVLKAIRDAITQSGQSRYAIFKATGIDQAQLSRLMQGRTGLSLETLEKLTEYLGLEIVIRAKRKKGRTDGIHCS